MTGRPTARRRRDPYRFELGLTEEEVAADLSFGRD
jgi:hypothetical protein